MAVNVEEQIITEIADRMREQIDLEVMADILNWTKLEIDRFVDNHHAIDIRVWLEQNAKGYWRNYGRTFYFAEEKNALWFSLKWM